MKKSCPRLSHILLISVSVVNVFPLWVIFKQAVTSEGESLLWPLNFWPRDLNIENILMFFKTQELLKSLNLSLFISVAVSFLSVGIGSLAGWAMARSVRLAAKLSSFLIVARMFPIVAVAIPLAVLFIKAGLYNHPLGLGLVFAHCIFVLPFVSLIMYSTFKAIPPDLEDQARVDGCSSLEAFFRVVLPMSRAGLAASFIISFILSWNEFGYSLLLQVTNRNLPPLLYYYASFGSVGIASAISLIMLIPALLILLLFQRKIASQYIGSSLR